MRSSLHGVVTLSSLSHSFVILKLHHISLAKFLFVGDIFGVLHFEFRMDSCIHTKQMNLERVLTSVFYFLSTFGIFLFQRPPLFFLLPQGQGVNPKSGATMGPN